MPARDPMAAQVSYLVSPSGTFDHHVDTSRSILRKQRVVPGHDERLHETIALTVNEWAQWGDQRRKRACDHILSCSPGDNLRIPR